MEAVAIAILAVIALIGIVAFLKFKLLYHQERERNERLLNEMKGREALFGAIRARRIPLNDRTKARESATHLFSGASGYDLEDLLELVDELFYIYQEIAMYQGENAMSDDFPDDTIIGDGGASFEEGLFQDSPESSEPETHTLGSSREVGSGGYESPPSREVYTPPEPSQDSGNTYGGGGGDD